jgi:hypothetical protein
MIEATNQLIIAKIGNSRDPALQDADDSKYKGSSVNDGEESRSCRSIWRQRFRESRLVGEPFVVDIDEDDWLL